MWVRLLEGTHIHLSWAVSSAATMQRCVWLWDRGSWLRLIDKCTLKWLHREMTYDMRLGFASCSLLSPLPPSLLVFCLPSASPTFWPSVSSSEWISELNCLCSFIIQYVKSMLDLIRQTTPMVQARLPYNAWRNRGYSFYYFTFVYYVNRCLQYNKT